VLKLFYQIDYFLEVGFLEMITMQVQMDPELLAELLAQTGFETLELEYIIFKTTGHI